MGLQRKGLCGGDDLHEKGQPGAEHLDRCSPNHAYRVMGDNLVQRLAVDNRGRKWMGAKPELGLRLTGGFDAKKFRNSRPRTPSVRLNHPGQPLDHNSSCCGVASPTAARQRASVRATASESRQG